MKELVMNSYRSKLRSVLITCVSHIYLIQVSAVFVFHPSTSTSIFRASPLHRKFNSYVTLTSSDKLNISSQENDIVERLDLTNQFNRWKFLQSILEDEYQSPNDVNTILYQVFKSFVDNPRPKLTPSGQTNPSPRLTTTQKDLLLNDLFIQKKAYETDSNNESSVMNTALVGVITALPMGDKTSHDFTSILKKLETLLPDPELDEDAHKSCWDLVIEMYGREATKMAQMSNDQYWNIRCCIVRLLIHYDFLNEGIGK